MAFRHKSQLCSRHRTATPALSSSGGGGIGGGGSGSAGLGGGGDDSDSPDEPEKKGILIRWQGWQERVAADPSFPYKVFIEQVRRRLVSCCDGLQEHLHPLADIEVLGVH